MRRSNRFSTGTPKLFTGWFAFVGLMMVVMVSLTATHLYLDTQDDIKYNCQPTGQQRMVNSMFHASDSAVSSLVVQDQFECDGGRIKWKTQYNNF